ncbi:1632_t:CDS:2 [Ambispora gerdemannii]|uniref:1632_t:CDS:1 n=1 Tax=Ambispora gerdemannii TaxID=144530 RepID=A0A9N8ZC63_9GLOM|nr:1632_t:CDS:2 [Ambispora gerdemannii]
MNNFEYLSETERKLLNECPYSLTLTIEELTKPSKKIRINCDKPPRPQNSWIIFRKDFEANIRLRSPGVKKKVKITANECSLKWKLQSSEVKDFFKILEKIACENHKRIYPNYKYKPKHAKNSNYKEFIFREQKKYVFSSSVKSNTINSNSPQEAMQIDGMSSSLTSNSPQEVIQIDMSPSLASNSPQDAIETDGSSSSLTANSPQEINRMLSLAFHSQINRLPFLTSDSQINGLSSLSTTIDNHQDTNNFTTTHNHHQDYTDDFTINDNVLDAFTT